MSRNFPLRTAATGRRSGNTPVYGTVPGGFAVRSTGSLSTLMAPARAAECCDCIPRVDARRANQRDELVVCVLLSGCGPAKASTASIPARRHRRDAARTRKLKKAAGQEFFIFIAKDLRDESQTGHLPVM